MSKKLAGRIFIIVFLTVLMPSCASGLYINYGLTLTGDAGNRLHITLDVSNISSDSLSLVVNWPLLDDFRNVYPNLFTMIHNISAKDPQGHELQIGLSQKSITSSNWHLSCYDFPIYYDVLTADTNGNTQITIQYDIASNTEIWTGLGGDVNSNPGDCKDFWAGYLEHILYRPENHQQVEDVSLKITVPSGWTYATVYPSASDTINLGTVDYMYGDNVRWKNYQRGNIILYKEGPFKLASKTIYGIKVMDVYSIEFDEKRSHDANFQYFEYLSDHIGILPVNAVLTFYPFIDGSSIPHLRVYQAGPYGWCHGLMGEYWGAGGDVGIGPGAELPQVQLWDFNSLDDEKSYSFPMHGLARYWIFQFIQLVSYREDWFKGGFCTYYENMAVGSKYGFDQIRNRRFRPMYEYYIENIAGPPEVDQINFTNHSFVKYFKAALTAYYINELLIEHSGGTKTIDDLMKILFDNALDGQALSKQSFLDALNSLTNHDFTNIVNDYLYGNEKLDLDKYFPPEATLIDYPTETVTGNTPKVAVTFTWTGSDPDNITPVEKLAYQYKLEGDLDYQDWSDWSSETTKIYMLPSGNYTFKVRAKDEAGNYPEEDESATAKSSFTVSLPIIVYPNPCYPNQGQIVTIANLPLDSEVKIYIYDLGSNLVRTLGESEATIEGGSKTITWDCRNDNGEVVARGIYIYFIPSATEKKTGKIAIMK